MSASRMLRFRHVFVLLLYASLGGILVSCSGSGTDEDSEWTVQEGALTLDRDLLVGDDEEFYFAQISDVAVRDDGGIYVADGKAGHVKVLAPGGALKDTVGRSGDEGPGTFRRVSKVSFQRGDSLYVVDGYYSRLSVYTPDHRFAYRISLRPQPPPPLYPGEIMVRKHAPGYVVQYGTPPLPGNSDAPSGRAVRSVGARGSVGDTLFTTPDPQMLVERGGDYVRMFQIPFARGPYVDMGPEGNIHYAWNDSLGVRVYDPDGELRRTVGIPFEPVPVTTADRERELSGRTEESRAAVEDEIPETKQAFEHFAIDDEGRYWFGCPTASPDSTDWWVADPEEKRVVTATLPSEVELMVVKDGRAYGRTTTEEGEPAVVRYQVRGAE